MGRTLYVSDLDGTLLGKDEKISAYAAETVNRLVQSGALFSFATARSADTALRTVEGVEVRVPVIVHNGAFVQDSVTREILHAELFRPGEAAEIFGAFRSAGLVPLTYSLIGGRMRFSYLRSGCGRAQWEFVLTRLGGERAREIFSEAQALDGELYYFSCIDGKERLGSVCDRLREKYNCIFSRDIYTGEWWLEVMPPHASKASAALFVKKMFSCDRLVCFGDEINDLPLFRVADECYAVGNAAPALKAAATGVIAPNTEDGVAHWLEEHALGRAALHNPVKTVYNLRKNV